MSWSLKVNGSKDDVKQLVEANDHIPDRVKTMIHDRIDALVVDEDSTRRILPANALPGVHVSTWGHWDSFQSNCTIEVQLTVIGLKPTT